MHIRVPSENDVRSVLHPADAIDIQAQAFTTLADGQSVECPSYLSHPGLSLLFILSAAEILGYTTNVSRHELCVRPLLQEASVVRADGKNRRDKIPGFSFPSEKFPVFSLLTRIIHGPP